MAAPPSHYNHPLRPQRLPPHALPLNRTRVVLAIAACTDVAICGSDQPPAAAGELVGIWDELVLGARARAGWLGKPRGPMRHLARQSPDLLAGRPLPPFVKTPPGWRAVIKDLPCPLGQVVLSVTARGDPLPGAPAEMPRLLRVGKVDQKEDERTMSWLGGTSFTSTHAFADLGRPSVDLEITIEGSSAAQLERLRAHSGSDAVVREFTHGVVLVNPSQRPYEFDLERLFPGRTLRRIQGTPLQDPKVNNGAPVGPKLTVPPQDALFLVGEVAAGR